MNLHHKIYEVLDALGEETLSTAEILPKLKDYKPTRRSLANFINEYMVNRYVVKERTYGTAIPLVKFRRIAR